MASDFFVPTTISAEAQEAAAAFRLDERNFDLPRPDDFEGWKKVAAALGRRFAEKNEKVVAEYAPTIEEQTIGGVPVLDIKPNGWQEDDRVLVYAHGGGFVVFSPGSTNTCAVPIAADSGLRIISIDYTLAPHAKWPAILDQVIAVVQGLVEAGHPLAKIAMFGDSAGGSITAGAVLKMRDEGLGMPAAVVLLSPWSDITGAGDTYETLKDADPILFWPKNLEHCAAAYADPADQQHPYVSPVYADYTKRFPPTLIQVGTKEIFLSDAVRHYRALAGADIDVTLDVYEGMWHVFQSFNPELPESKLARKKMARFLEKNM